MAKTNPNGEMTKMHIIVLVAGCLMAWGTMGMLNAYGVFFTPMGEALHAGRAAVTLHYSLRTLVTGLAAPLVALLLEKRIDLKKTMPIGLVLYLVSSILISRSRSLILVDVLAVVAGFGLALVSYMLITIILGNWFHKNLGTFTGIAFAFSGIGSAIASPIVTRLMDSLGYQKVYVLYAVITALMIVPTLFIPFSPDNIDLKPYGEGQAADLKKEKQEGYLDLPYKAISFAAIILSALTILIVGDTSLNSHLPSLAVDNGFTADTGALLLSASMIGNLTFKLILGVIIDKWGVIKGFIIVLLISILGFGLILISKGSTAPLLAGGYLYGTIFSLGSLGLTLLTRYLYGNEQYNKVYAKIAMMTSIGSAAFVTIIGALYDMTGSYQVPMVLGLLMEVVSLLLIFLLAAKVRRSKS